MTSVVRLNSAAARSTCTDSKIATLTLPYGFCTSSAWSLACTEVPSVADVWPLGLNAFCFSGRALDFDQLQPHLVPFFYTLVTAHRSQGCARCFTRLS
mgnify:CR=1 FL=1